MADCSNLVRLYKNNEKLTTRYYTTEYRKYANGSLVFKCLTNYHVVEGDLELRCENNVFVGVEPRCEVDYYMEKKRLSAMIILVSLLLPGIWLLLDFGRFVKLRKRQRYVAFKPKFNRSRVHMAKIGFDELGIIHDVMKYIRTTKGVQDDNYSIGRKALRKSFGESEDIFVNKTIIKPEVSTDQPQEENQFQLMGAARAFGKIGRILTKDLF
ncbi:hypothetical protein RRG08_021516 [Elysia crispata]|uniref:Sushi domain-containing protein n=1 Tax=Elysia crispata TaxID=231223 RepID=A0AAE1BBL4_9GAST|nr:hypothetical protein RRG08_021516 [Elysia crispata]